MGEVVYAYKACCIIKTKTRSIIFNNAACFRFNNAACRFSTCKITPDNFPATKKDRTRFSHTVSLHYFSLDLADVTVTSFLNSVFVEKEQVPRRTTPCRRETSFGSYYLSKIIDLRTSSENSSKILATTSAIQYKRYSRVQKLASNFKFRRENHPSLAGNVLY